jgi:hypothetical protein
LWLLTYYTTCNVQQLQKNNPVNPLYPLGVSIPHQRVCCCGVQVPVVFFSLLRKGTPDRDRSEAKLAEAFDYVSDSWVGGPCNATCIGAAAGCCTSVLALQSPAYGLLGM